jgi:hypothetical protein
MPLFHVSLNLNVYLSLEKAFIRCLATAEYNDDVPSTSLCATPHSANLRPLPPVAKIQLLRMLQEMIASAEVYSIRQGRQVIESLPATDVDYTHNSVCNKTSPEKSKRVARPPGFDLGLYKLFSNYPFKLRVRPRHC